MSLFLPRGNIAGPSRATVLSSRSLRASSVGPSSSLFRRNESTSAAAAAAMSTTSSSSSSGSSASTSAVPTLADAEATRSGGRRRRKEVPSSGVDLVAPPDPISNIRPIIYSSTPARRRSSNSPYSAAEFPTSSYSSSSSSAYNSSVSGSGRAGARSFEKEVRLAGMELEWRLRRERVDLMNHRFWANVNSNFNAQLSHRLSLLPKSQDPPTELDIRRRDDCLSQFYADWQIANRDSQIRWVKNWWREVWAGLRTQGKIYLVKAFRR